MPRMRISTLCNMCYIVVSRELLLYVFFRKLLHYTSTNLQTGIARFVSDSSRGLSATAELLVIMVLGAQKSSSVCVRCNNVTDDRRETDGSCHKPNITCLNRKELPYQA